MHNSVKYILASLVGAAIGSAVTWKIVKKKYERIAQEEIDSVKEFYSEKYGKKTEDSNEETLDREAINKETLGEYKKHVNAYVSHSSEDDKKGGSESMDNFGPQVISPEEYGEIYEYETISLIYYADDVLTDDADEIIEDIEATVGYNFHKHFDEYSDDPDTVYVRNHRLKCDYEICKDTAKYSDVVGSALNPVDDE